MIAGAEYGRLLLQGCLGCRGEVDRRVGVQRDGELEGS